MADCPKSADAPPLVLIEREDGPQPIASWQYLVEMEPPRIVKCRSVGWLVHDDANVKALAPNVGEMDTDHAQASGVIRIPTRCVTCVRKLRTAR